MKCSCGGKIVVKDTRGNDYVVYRLRRCSVCNKEFVTKEVKMDYAEGKHIMYKIHSIKYGEVKPVKRRRRKRE